MPTSFGRMTKILQDPSTSAWMKAALTTAMNRDPVDAVAEAELLLSVVTARLAEIQPPT